VHRTGRQVFSHHPIACAVVVPVLFALSLFAAVFLSVCVHATHAVHAFIGQAMLVVVAVALAAAGLALQGLPRLGCGAQAQVLDVIELADAVVVVVAAQVHQLGASGLGSCGGWPGMVWPGHTSISDKCPSVPLQAIYSHSSFP